MDYLPRLLVDALLVEHLGLPAYVVDPVEGQSKHLGDFDLGHEFHPKFCRVRGAKIQNLDKLLQGLLRPHLL